MSNEGFCSNRTKNKETTQEMKVSVFVDMRGISGVTHAEHVLRKGKDNERARKLVTGEVDAPVKEVFEAGAKRVVVKEAIGRQPLDVSSS